MAKVLIVDDSQIYRFKLRKLVEARGHEALTANNGEQALQLAREEQPDIILMDIVMPGMSGYEAKRSLARDPATTQIPVIFVSSRSADSDRMWGRNRHSPARSLGRRVLYRRDSLRADLARFGRAQRSRAPRQRLVVGR